jgi:MFS family permease
MAVLGAAQLMVMLDSTVVNVALPSIGRSLPAGTAALQWTVGSYVLTYGSLLLLGGRIADVFGRRRSFLAGLALFGAASALCGLAPATPALLAGRFAQGAGAAVLSAAALSAVLAVYRSPGRRRIALAAWSGLGVVGATIGVILGGLLTTALGWRWAFLINVPVAVLTGLAALRAVPPLAAVRRRPLRLPIALLTTGGPAALSYGLIRLQDGLGTPAAWAGIAVAVLLLALVTVRQAGAEDPLLPLHLLRSPTYALSCAGLSLAAAVMIAGTYLAAGYFQRAHGMPAFAAGLALLPMALSSLLVAVVVPRARRTPGARAALPLRRGRAARRRGDPRRRSGRRPRRRSGPGDHRGGAAERLRPALRHRLRPRPAGRVRCRVRPAQHLQPDRRRARRRGRGHRGRRGRGLVAADRRHRRRGRRRRHERRVRRARRLRGGGAARRGRADPPHPARDRVPGPAVTRRTASAHQDPAPHP